MKKALHLIYADNGDKTIYQLAEDLSKYDFLHVVVVFSPDQLKETLLTFSKTKKQAHVWIHLQKFDKNSVDEIPRNLQIINWLKEKEIVNKEAQLYFLTSGTVDDIKGVSEVTEISAKHSGELVFSQKVFLEKYRDQLPPPQDIDDLLAHNYKRVGPGSFRFSKEDWDWRVENLEDIISDRDIRAILGELFDHDEKDEKQKPDFLLSIVNPGYSGAYVLSVVYNTEEGGGVYLLKFSKEESGLREEYEKALQLVFKNLHPPTFIGAHPLSNKKVYGWHCLLFHFAIGKSTLRKWMREECVKPTQNSTINVIPNIADKWSVFENDFEKKKRFISGLNPYLGTTKESKQIIKGLKVGRKKQWLIFQTLDLLDKWNSINREDTLINATDLKYFKSFLRSDRGEFRGTTITKYSNEGTPLSYVHGDFHTANILINEEGEEISFIDFANVPDQPTRHAFSDWGKLSSDLEVSVMPESIIIDQPDKLKLWIATHRLWLNEEKWKKEPSAIQQIYSWNTQIRSKIIARGEEFGLSKEEALRQFYMVRLHYFLKTLSYRFECREKLIFCLRAAIDILEFLIQPPPS